MATFPTSCAPLEARAPLDTGLTPVLTTDEVLLPYRPESASQARKLVRRKLTELGLSHLIDSAELVASELVTNAAKTGCGLHITVTIQRVADATVRISVRDGSRSLPVLIRASDDDEGHRGLSLVHQLTAGRWGVTVEPFGKVVHADITQ
ncbi:ATP-binding protein [Kitasatospora sp. NPDC088351]|uniref:ATP-binding protein n=1 Tax=unclassified Kitasatospora TaxID=2633591 RepID=UPI00343830C8